MTWKCHRCYGLFDTLRDFLWHKSECPKKSPAEKEVRAKNGQCKDQAEVS